MKHIVCTLFFRILLTTVKCNNIIDVDDILSENFMPGNLLILENNMQSMFSNVTRNFKTNTLSGNYDDAISTMGFHRSKMNEYLCRNFLAEQVVAEMSMPKIRKRLGIADESSGTTIKENMIHDEGSKNYKNWLSKSTTLEDIYRHYEADVAKRTDEQSEDKEDDEEYDSHVTGYAYQPSLKQYGTNVNNNHNAGYAYITPGIAYNGYNNQIGVNLGQNGYSGIYDNVNTNYGAGYAVHEGHSSKHHNSGNKDKDLTELLEIASTALAYLSFGVFIIHVIMCVSSVSNNSTTVVTMMPMSMNPSGPEPTGGGMTSDGMMGNGQMTMTGGGSMTMTGTGGASMTMPATGGGSMTMTGTGGGSMTMTGTGGGSMTMPGTGGGSMTMTGAGGGSMTMTGTGAGSMTMTGTGDGMTMTGTGNGNMAMTGTGGGSMTMTGTGNGNMAMPGTGGESMTMTGTGGGSMTGTGGGSMTMTGMNGDSMTGTGEGTMPSTNGNNDMTGNDGTGNGDMGNTGVGNGETMTSTGGGNTMPGTSDGGDTGTDGNPTMPGTSDGDGMSTGNGANTMPGTSDGGDMDTGGDITMPGTNDGNGMTSTGGESAMSGTGDGGDTTMPGTNDGNGMTNTGGGTTSDGGDMNTNGDATMPGTSDGDSNGITGTGTGSDMTGTGRGIDIINKGAHNEKYVTSINYEKGMIGIGRGLDVTDNDKGMTWTTKRMTGKGMGVGGIQENGESSMSNNEDGSRLSTSGGIDGMTAAETIDGTSTQDNLNFRYKRTVKSPVNNNYDLNELTRRILISIEAALIANNDDGMCLRKALCDNNKYSRSLKTKSKIWIPVWSLGMSWLSGKLTKNIAPATSMLDSLKASILGLGNANCEIIYQDCNLKEEILRRKRRK